MHSEYADRRHRLIDSMAQGVLLQFAAPVTLRNNDVEHEYRQDSDFYYLTGLDEPESVLVLTANAEKPYVLFVRPRDGERETWDGERVGVDGVMTRFAADAAYPISELPTQLLELMKGQRRLYYAVGRNPKHDAVVFGVLQQLRERVRRGESGPSEIVEPSTVLHEMRLIKAEVEVASLRRAIAITRDGYRALWSRTRPGMAEYELEAILRAEYRRQGSERCAFAPIVASGRNGRILHHRRNDRTIGDGELIVVDSGAEYDYLAADITRTFPSNGKFAPMQRRAYEVVLRAQEKAIAAAVPGATIDEVHLVAVRELCAGLIDLGVLTGSPQSVLESEAYKKYYMHRTSHWLGMDVHDVGAYHRDGKPRPLVPGMVLTVEPGLYFAADDAGVPDGLKDVGIRIEDDILVAAQGPVNLSAGIAKTVDDIEREMASGSGTVEPR